MNDVLSYVEKIDQLKAEIEQLRLDRDAHFQRAERACIERDILREILRNVLELAEGMVPELEPEELPTTARLRTVLGKARAAVTPAREAS